MASGSEGDLVDAVVEHLRRDGFVLEAGLARDAFVVASHRGTPMPHAPELTIPPALFAEYLHGMARGMDDHPDPFTEALSLTRIHLVEALDTDHGDGLNHVSALGYRRRRGRVEFFVETEPPPDTQR